MKASDARLDRASMPSSSHQSHGSQESLLKPITRQSSRTRLFGIRSLIHLLATACVALLLFVNAWMWLSSSPQARIQSHQVRLVTTVDDDNVNVEENKERMKNLENLINDIHRVMEANSVRTRLGSQQVMPLGIESYDCVHNPSRHYERTGTWRPECSAIAPPSFSRHPENAWPSSSYMLSLETDESLVAYDDRRHAMARHKIDLRRFIAVNGVVKFGHLYEQEFDEVRNSTVRIYHNPRLNKRVAEGDLGFLTPGEEGYRATMKKIFQLLLRDENATSALIVDDDVMLSCTFSSDLRKLLKEPRCGAHVSSDTDHGGVLLLGSSIWLNGTYPQRGPWLSGWNIVDEDLRHAAEQQARVVHGGPTCFNVPSKVMGSFAVIYHRNVFQPIVDWLESSSRPFDHVFEALADAGFIVRAAYPSIAVQDLHHESSVDPSRKSQQDVEVRSRMHRWQLDKICHPRTNKVVLPRAKATTSKDTVVDHKPQPRRRNVQVKKT